MKETSNQVEDAQPKNIIEDELSIKCDDNIKKYTDDIFLISDFLLKNAKTTIDESQGSMYKYCDKKKYFNEKGTKLNDEKCYEDIIRILSEYAEIDECIFIYFEKLGIHLVKVLIKRYISCEEQNTNILSILKKVGTLLVNNENISYIYKKLSKIFRLNLKDNASEEDIKSSFKKFSRLFDIWKIMYNYEDYKNKYMIFSGKNCVNIKINNINKEIAQSFIYINFVKSPLLNINNGLKDCTILRIYNTKDQYKDIKFDDLFGNDKRNLSNINAINFTFHRNQLFYTIIEDKGISGVINDYNFAQNEINRIEILKNFYGKISSIEFSREESQLNNIYKKPIKYVINPDKTGIDIYKEKMIEDDWEVLGKKIETLDINLENDTFIPSKYYPKNNNYMKNIKYLGGFESFLPLFKIMKYYINKLEDKKEIIISNTKDMVKTIINHIHISEYNLMNFYDIIIPLTGALSSISDKLSEDEKNSLFHNNIMNILYLYIITSPLPKSSKHIFKEVLGFPDEKISIPDIDYNDNIFKKNLSKINNLDWYCFILFIHFGINILLSKNLIEVFKVIDILFEKFKEIIALIKNNDTINFQKQKMILNIKLYVGLINYLFKEDIKEFKEYGVLSQMSNFLSRFVGEEYKEDLASKCLLVIELFYALQKFKLDIEKNEIFNKFKEFFSDKEKIIEITESNEDEKTISNLKKQNIYINIFKPYIRNNLSVSDEEIQINEFIDYKIQFRKLMKEQFMFNNKWSNKKLFFNKETRRNQLKYKIKNYYTWNYQRPIIYPLLDYKSQYPKFKEYSIGNDFYLTEENKDDYNFTIESESFDDILEKHYDKYFKKITTTEEYEEGKFIKYNVCLIKSTHHIKGIILFENKIGLKNFYFIGYNYKKMNEIPKNNKEIELKEKEISPIIEEKRKKENEIINNSHCNQGNNLTKLCYGPTFPCPEKDSYIKLKFNINDIRLIMRRIYFYRKSGLEIFINNKSYYFNFAVNPLSKNDDFKNGELFCKKFFDLIGYTLQKIRCPLSINKEIIGYIDLYTDEFKKSSKNFVDYLLEHWRDKKNEYSKDEKDISTFDMITILNLISNRSYNDVYQYPIFPLLYFKDVKEIETQYDEESLIPRDLSIHIGFQNQTERGRMRADEIIEIYETNGGINPENLGQMCYFRSLYSSGMSVANFLVRIFPYCFMNIEFQGSTFDDSGRLFRSILDTYENTSYVSLDFRELIPELYYLPEILINIDKINFGIIKNSKKQINNVELPNDYLDLQKGEIISFFSFIAGMKKHLEERKKIDIFSWLKIIFGDKQKYRKENHKDYLFYPVSYISFDKNYGKIFEEGILARAEQGTIPLQTIYDSYKLSIPKEELSIKQIDKKAIDTIINNSKDYYIINLNDKKKLNCKMNKEYIFKDNNNNEIKILSDDLGKIEIYLDNIFIKRYYDQKDIITSIDYNKRLNMFITSSLDGYVCLYSFPNKLFTVIKNPNNNYFDYVLLAANPFPFIIAYDKKTKEFYSYSLNGIFIDKKDITELIENKEKVKIFPLFDTNGGTHNDTLIISRDKGSLRLDLPFFKKQRIE